MCSTGTGTDARVASAAASACQSMEAEQGVEAGEAGLRGVAGTVQQPGVEQVAGPRLQHLQADPRASGADPPAAFRSGTKVPAAPSATTSSRADQSLIVAGIRISSRANETKISQFFNSPQSSIDLP